MSGRGAWSSKGRGGTLKVKDGATVPGPFYLLGVKVPLVGSAARDAVRAGNTPSSDDLAVNFGVKAIQKLLNYVVPGTLALDGVFGKGTDAAVRAYQHKQVLKVDGSVGPTTMKQLLLPHIKRIGGKNWQVVYGLLKNEGGFDPGAVGVIDESDLGLAQINGRAHPDMTVEQRFDPIVAVQFNADYLLNALDKLGNVRDAVLSYNLGIGGVRTWIKLGRPRYYSPDSGPKRDTTAYVDRVLDAYKEL